MKADFEEYTESEFVNYGKDVMALLKQHNLIAPGEAESIRKSLYYS